MSQYTPMITHYLEIKKSYPDTLIFYRLGDFYEMFFDDAKTASHELNLVLTGRNAGVDTCLLGNIDSDPRCDYIISDLLDLLPILEG